MQIRVRGIDAAEFPQPVPFFHCFFTGDGCGDIIEAFKIDESFTVVFPRKALDLADAMLPDPFDQIGRNPDVEGPVFPIGHDVNVSALSHAWTYA